VKLLLDTGVLGQIRHPRKHANVRVWFRDAVNVHDFFVSELADYELRRELLRLGAVRSLSRLDELTREIPYVPITTATWRRAAALWAAARNAGNVTAPLEALDGDVLVAAQALEESAVVLTNNTRHFDSLSVKALDWPQVALPVAPSRCNRRGARAHAGLWGAKNNSDGNPRAPEG
jgi:predicted nucleic acid-binding protein